MNPIRGRMKKRKASSGQNGQLVHWWLLIHSGQSRRGLNQSCSPRRDLSNAMSHSQIGCREEVDSRLLVVSASLTPDLSFAHNLGWRCPNGQCEAIFDIYVSRPFQWHQKHPNSRCFGPFCRALNIRESRRTPNPQLFQVLGFTPTLGQSGVATAIAFEPIRFRTISQQWVPCWSAKNSWARQRLTSLHPILFYRAP
jgi:hypothetical protein